MVVTASLDGSVSFSPEFATKFRRELRNACGAVAIVSA